MSNLYSQRNYHFLHNQLSASNPFNNISTYNAYQQKASSLPKNNIPQTTPLSNTQIPLLKIHFIPTHKTNFYQI